MFFFNDECDFRDDDQYDFFTLATEVERRRLLADFARKRLRYRSQSATPTNQIIASDEA